MERLFWGLALTKTDCMIRAMARSLLLFAGIAALAVLVVGGTASFLSANSTLPQYGPPFGSTASMGSTDGLVLSLTLNSSVISQGQTVSLTVGEWNGLNARNNVPSSKEWPFEGLGVGPCGYLNYPFGFEILPGYYTNTSTGLNSAQKLQLYEPGTYSCPAILSGISSYSFYPLSSLASVMGTCGSEPCFTEEMNTTTTVKGYWSGDSFEVLPPGTYTVVVGDEWGALLLGHFVVTSPGSVGTVILPSNASIVVSSSYDCVAGHFALPFKTQVQSVLTGGFSAKAPGVTLYVATAQQAGTVFHGHPASWLYSTGLQDSSSFVVVLSPGSYVVWIEGADLNCGSQIVTPLEQLTSVNITEAFVVSAAVATSS